MSYESMDPKNQNGSPCKPDEIHPDGLQLGVQICQQMNGFIDIGCQKASRKKMDHRLQPDFPVRDQQAPGYSSQKGKFRHMDQNLYGCVSLGRILKRGEKESKEVQENRGQSCVIGQRAPPDQTEIAYQQDGQDRCHIVWFSGQWTAFFQVI